MADIRNQMRLPSNGAASTETPNAAASQPAAPSRRPSPRMTRPAAESIAPAAKPAPTIDVETQMVDEQSPVNEQPPASEPAAPTQPVRRRNTLPPQPAQEEVDPNLSKTAARLIGKRGAPPAPKGVEPVQPPTRRGAPRMPAPAPAPDPDPAPAPVDRLEPSRNVERAIALRKPDTTFSCGGFDDGMDDAEPTDIVLPRLNISQKVGELSQVFEAGTLVLGSKIALENPSNILVLGKKHKVFVERVPGGNPGRTLYSKEEVADAGGTLDYNESRDREIPLFQTMITWMVLVQAPSDASEEEIKAFPFHYAPTGQRFALALWSTKGTAYTHAAKHLITARKHGMFKGAACSRIQRGGFLAQFFTLATKIEKYDRNFAAIPVLELGEETTPEFAAWVRSELSGEEASEAIAAAADRTPQDRDDD